MFTPITEQQNFYLGTNFISSKVYKYIIGRVSNLQSKHRLLLHRKSSWVFVCTSFSEHVDDKSTLGFFFFLPFFFLQGMLFFRLHASAYNGKNKYLSLHLAVIRQVPVQHFFFLSQVCVLSPIYLALHTPALSWSPNTNCTQTRYKIK